MDTFEPGARLVIGNPPGALGDEILIELLIPCVGVRETVEVGGNSVATNFGADDDRDGLVDEDGINGFDDDFDFLVDEDPPGVDPIEDGAPGVGLDGGASGPGDQALERIGNTGDDRVDFTRAAGSPGS